MTGAAGHHRLHDAIRVAGETVRVVLGLDVPGDHRDPKLTSQIGQGALEQLGLSRTGRGHQVEGEDAGLLQAAPHLPGDLVVLRHHALAHVNGPNGHRPPPDTRAAARRRVAG